MLFSRTKPLDLILETASKRSLSRQLGAFDLTMLGIGPTNRDRLPRTKLTMQ